MSDFDEKLIQRLTKLEREVERLKVKESPIMSNYLLTTGKAADSDKLDGLDSTDFVPSTQFPSTDGTWASWTPTQTGWTALPTGFYRYSQIGKLVMCSVIMTAGNSDATTAVLSLPVNAATAGSSPRGTWGWAMDNGTQLTTPGGWQIKFADQTISFYKTSVDGAAWTASGTKRIYCMFFYEAA